MAYTRSMIDQAVDVLTRRIPGLTREAAAVWVRSEQGVNNNVLGVTDGRGHLFSYPTLVAGATAAAALFNNSSYYVRARRDVAGSSDPGAQLRAIAASPWNGGHYRRSTVFAPYLQGARPPRGTGIQTPGATPTPAGTPTSPGAAGTSAVFKMPTVEALRAVFAPVQFGRPRVARSPAPTPPPSPAPVGSPPAGAPFIDIPDGHVLTMADAYRIAGLYKSAGFFDGIGGNLAWMTTFSILQKAAARKEVWGPALRAQLQGQFGEAAVAANPVGAAVSAFLNWEWVPGLVVNLAILAAILILGYRGVREILG